MSMGRERFIIVSICLEIRQNDLSHVMHTRYALISKTPSRTTLCSGTQWKELLGRTSDIGTNVHHAQDCRVCFQSKSLQVLNYVNIKTKCLIFHTYR